MALPHLPELHRLKRLPRHKINRLILSDLLDSIDLKTPNLVTKKSNCVNQDETGDLVQRTRFLLSLSFIYKVQIKSLNDEVKEIVERLGCRKVKRRRVVRNRGTRRATGIIDDNMEIGDVMEENIIDNYNSFDNPLDDITLPSHIEMARAADDEVENDMDSTIIMRPYNIREPKLRRPQLTVSKPAFILQCISDKLKEISAANNLNNPDLINNTIEVGRNELDYDYVDNDNFNDLGSYTAENFNDSAFDAHLDSSFISLLHEEGCHTLSSLTFGKNREEQVDIFYGLLVNLERGNVYVEHENISKCYGEVVVRRMDIVV